MYAALKHIHMLTAFISITFFGIRVWWRLSSPEKLTRKWVRIAPHVNDTLLLAAAIGLTLILQQYPFQADWLTGKVIGLVGYIIFGFIALKRAATPRGVLMATAAAYACVALILKLAFTKQFL
ncbi:SirB2 family protein [Hahella sp. SMD15-11]|uniref:SirB2 family protein n=1 Tax=Thermohahella caldifontis TaxID=3142973 RepID=A0AB39V010_9GAMM